MQGYVPGEQPPPGKYIKLNTNENPYPPSPAVRRSIAEVAEHALTRYPDPLATAFRLRAGEVLGVEPDAILCGNGSDDILTIVTRALVGEGDLLRLPYPSYVLYRTLAEIQGAAFEEVAFASDWSLTAAFACAAPRLRLVFLANPNSPSGTVIPPDQVLELAERLPCPLLVDEAYADFADTHCLDLVHQCRKILVSRSLSKSYALAGLRFGFVVAHPDLITQLRKVKDSYNCDALAIAGATAALDDQAWRQENRARILATRQRMETQLRALGLDVVPSQANFVWCTHPVQPLRPVYEQLKASYVLVRYMNYPGWGDGLRISVGTDAQVDACVTLLKAIL
ncbi:MAG: histidinol-phosphate transaminase [Pirellulaceae bacterium]|jgi:histidinol-phosphate aminotransferase|nr:histidinol-phosphate transaminase [Pirellulaceae bacterium]